MLPLFLDTGPLGKASPTRRLHGSPDSLPRMSCRVMHREKQHRMPLCVRQERDQRFLLPISLHLLDKSCAPPLLFPRDPSLRQPGLQGSLVPRAWHHRLSAHHRQGTAIQDTQTASWYIASSLRCDPVLPQVPVNLGMSIAFAVLGFTSKQRPSPQRVCRHGRKETPPASLPTPPLHTILFCAPGILSARMGMQKTRIDSDPLVSLLRWTLTIAADCRERIRPLLAHRRLLAQGTRAIFRPSPTASQAFQGAWDGACMGHPVRRSLCAAHAQAWQARSCLADVFHTPAPVSVLRRLTEWWSAGDDGPEGARRARSPCVARLWCSSPPDCVRHPSPCSSD
jgi:hypothetical protein